jgi:hypothetical protein
MDLAQAAETWAEDGFVVLPEYLPTTALNEAVGELPSLFPTGEEFHDHTDPGRNARFLGDEFNGIDSFPFASRALNHLPVCDALIDLATTFLDVEDVRLYSAEVWAKFEGAADYDQNLHRDYLNHTILVPSTAPGFRQLECFVFLSDVTVELGAPRMVARSPETEALPARPNFFPRTDTSSGDPFVSSKGRPDLYAHEVAATGKAGTVVAFQPGTLHRGAAITQRRGARFTMHLNYRPAAVEWAQRHAWAYRSHDPHWYEFVSHASPRQLQIFGWPPPGHPYWTPETLTGIRERYPQLDVTPWQQPAGA